MACYTNPLIAKLEIGAVDHQARLATRRMVHFGVTAPFINRFEREVAIHRPFGERGNFGFLSGESPQLINAFNEAESRITIENN